MFISVDEPVEHNRALESVRSVIVKFFFSVQWALNIPTVRNVYIETVASFLPLCLVNENVRLDRTEDYWGEDLHNIVILAIYDEFNQGVQDHTTDERN